MQDPKFLTVEEVGELLRVSRWSISRYIDAGELTAIKVGGQLRIPVSSYLDYLQTHTVQPVTTKE